MRRRWDFKWRFEGYWKLRKGDLNFLLKVDWVQPLCVRSTLD
jgi:hypothetical protein